VAEKGKRSAQLKLFFFFRDGSCGIAPDKEKAAYWQKKYEETLGIKK